MSVNAKPGTLKEAMLLWLAGLQGQGCMPIQQLMGQSADITSIQNTFNLSGKWVAGPGCNFFNNDDTLSPEPFGAQGVTAAIPYWQAGGVVWLSGFNLPNPSGGGAQAGYVNTADWFSAPAADGSVTVNQGSKTSNAWHATLDQIAGGMQPLVDAGVVFCLRILHELSGSWWYWGPAGGKNSGLTGPQFVALWKDTWNYLNNVKGLADHIIWIWAVNGADNVPDRYPGSQYVDMVGFSWYTNTPNTGTAAACYNNLAHFGKPVGWAEWGGDKGQNAMDIVNALKTQCPQIIWIEFWSTQWSIDNLSNVSAAMNDPHMLTRDKLNRPTKGLPVAAASPTNTVVKAGSGQTIIDTKGNAWGINPAGVVTFNGNPIAGTSGIATLFWDGTHVWEENPTFGATGTWWEFDGSGTNTSISSTTTSPIPGAAPPAPTPAPAPAPAPTPAPPAVTHASVQGELDSAMQILQSALAHLATLSP